METGDRGLHTLFYGDALAIARAKPPGARTFLVMTEEQAERFITSRKLTGDEPSSA
jgi:hypothetical protein